MDTTPTILGFPLNRIIAFVGPYVSLASGAAVSWLFVHAHFLALFHLNSTGLATSITQGAILALTAGLTWLGQQQWLKGHHIEVAAQAQAAALRNPVFTTPVADPSTIPPDEGNPTPIPPSPLA